jgi:dipeptidase E
MKVLIASTSTVYGDTYLNYLKEPLIKHFEGINELLFIPYARPDGMSHDAYTEIAKKFFEQIHINVKGIHTFKDSQKAIENAEAIFTGGGNTFVLVKMMYENNLWNVLSQKILNGTPYFGTSAGANITGQTMQTTNDMPIVSIPNYKTLGIFPFNINPHYLDPKPDLLQHMGETRDTRLKEYLHFNTVPVVALREGSWIKATQKSYLLQGKLPVRIYFGLNNIKEIDSETFTLKNMISGEQETVSYKELKSKL